MKNNVIILTTGISGSSLVTSLVAQGGFWTGDETVVKNNSTGNYDTHENKRLIELNNQLIKSLSYEYNNDAQYHNKAHIIFERATNDIDTREYIEFINYCNTKGKWIWKDPRLWITIGFWQSIIKRDSTKVILVYRDPLSLWVSLQNKRQIVSYSYLKQKEKFARSELCDYLYMKGIDYHMLCYDELIVQPENVISSLNQYLNISLSINDLENVYIGNLRYKTWNYIKLLKAILIYIKNINLRRKDYFLNLLLLETVLNKL